MFSVKDNALNRASQNAGESPKMVRFGTQFATLTMVALLAGCAGQDYRTTNSVPDDYRTSHPIVVSDSEEYKDIAVSSNNKGLSLRDRNVVRDFARRFKRSGSKTMQMILPVGSKNERAAVTVSRYIAEEIKEVGVGRGSISIKTYHATGHGDAATIRLAFTSLTAGVASQCGIWDDDLNNTFANRNYSNYGCATQNNLAAMVSNPADLLGPRGESEIDATRRDAVITEWREDGSLGLPDLLSE